LSEQTTIPKFRAAVPQGAAGYFRFPRETEIQIAEGGNTVNDYCEAIIVVWT